VVIYQDGYSEVLIISDEKGTKFTSLGNETHLLIRYGDLVKVLAYRHSSASSYRYSSNIKLCSTKAKLKKEVNQMVTYIGQLVMYYKNVLIQISTFLYRNHTLI